MFYSTVARMRVYRTIRKKLHGFTTGQAIYLNQQNEWALAKANSEFTLAVAIAERIDKDNFNVVFSGIVTKLSNMRIGEYYFVSDTVSGELTTVEPTNSSSFSNPILIAIASDTGIVLNLRPEALSLPEVKFETEAVYPLKTESTTISLNPDNSSHGDLLFRNANRWDRLPAGSSGQILISNGQGEDPSWAYSSYKSYIPIQLGRNSTEYSAATIYYIGSFREISNNLMQNANIQKIKSPINGRIVKANHIIFANSGSGESCIFKIKNLTKDIVSQSWSLPINTISGSNNLINLNLEVSEGDDILTIMETPSSWAAQPTQVQQSFILYLEPNSQNSNYILNP